jgi:hypothetical protein
MALKLEKGRSVHRKWDNNLIGVARLRSAASARAFSILTFSSGPRELLGVTEQIPEGLFCLLAYLQPNRSILV